MSTVLLRILPYIVAALIGAAGSWVWQANRYETTIATNEAARRADLTRIGRRRSAGPPSS